MGSALWPCCVTFRPMLLQRTRRITLCAEPGSVGQMSLRCGSRATALPSLDSACLPMFCLPSLLVSRVCASQGALQEHLAVNLRLYHLFGIRVSHGFMEAGCAALYRPRTAVAYQQ